MVLSIRRRIFQALFLVLLPAFTALADDEPAITKAGGKVTGLGGGIAVEFHLTARDLSDVGLACVAGRTDIISLNLRDTKITDAGLMHLTTLSGLKRLHLERTAISDDGIEHLAGLKNLEYLNLYSTKITDASLGYLKELESLIHLFIWETDISDDGARRLQTALPNLKITGGVDLDKIAAEAAKKAKEPTEPMVDLEWHPAGPAEPPVSVTGTFTTVYFENKRRAPVKLFWVQYGKGGLKFYADIGAGKTLKRNTFSDATWVITDENEQPLGYFRSVLNPSRAVIPESSLNQAP
jgi:hypothetical protein